MRRLRPLLLGCLLSAGAGAQEGPRPLADSLDAYLRRQADGGFAGSVVMLAAMGLEGERSTGALRLSWCHLTPEPAWAASTRPSTRPSTS